MFLRAKLGIFLILALLASSIVYSVFFFPIINDKSSKYRRFSTEKAPKITDGIYQYREGVVKELWAAKNGERFRYHLESPSSQFQCVDDEMVEILNNMTLTIQDKDLRNLKATQGTFHYKRKLLEANNAFVNTRDFQGVAKELLFYFRSYPATIFTKDFHAEYKNSIFSSDEVEYYSDKIVLKGHVHVKHGKDLIIHSDKLIWKTGCLEIQGSPLLEGINFGKLTCDSNLLFDLDKSEITAEDRMHPLVFTRSNLTIQSEKICLYIEDTKPQQITFSEHVKLFNHSLIGIAHDASYDFIDHSIKLVAGPNEEVLFYNKDKNLSLAAPAIRIDGDVVRGFGKVRFTFEESEKENILNLLKECLRDTF